MGGLRSGQCPKQRKTLPCVMQTGNGTHKRRLRGGGETGWGSDWTSERERFRFREVWEVSSSLSSESVECVSEGVADRLRDG